MFFIAAMALSFARACRAPDLHYKDTICTSWTHENNTAVGSWEECCSLCTNSSECIAWTFYHKSANLGEYGPSFYDKGHRCFTAKVVGLMDNKKGAICGIDFLSHFNSERPIRSGWFRFCHCTQCILVFAVFFHIYFDANRIYSQTQGGQGFLRKYLDTVCTFPTKRSRHRQMPSTQSPCPWRAPTHQEGSGYTFSV